MTTSLAPVLSAAVAAALAVVPGPPPEGAPLPLPFVLRQLREDSGPAAAARQRTQAAVEALAQARKPPNPSIDLRVENWDLKKGRMPEPWDQLDVFAVASVPVEVGGKRSARSSAAAAGLAGARAEERLTGRDLQLEATALYVGSLKARALVETSRSILEGISRLVATTSRKVEEGYAAEADLLRFRAEEGRLSAQLARSRLSLARSVSQLAALLGRDRPVEPGNLVEPEWPSLPDGDAFGLATSALHGRPEIAAAEARVERARELSRLERARRIPDPSLTGGWKRTGGQDTAVLGVVVAVPVFDSGSAAARRALAEERAAQFDLETLRRRLLADTADRILRARELAERARSAERNFLLPAQGAVRAARASFREGATDTLRLVDAERVYAEARRETQDLKLDALEASIEALLVLGQELPE